MIGAPKNSTMKLLQSFKEITQRGARSSCLGHATLSVCVDFNIAIGAAAITPYFNTTNSDDCEK